MNVYTYIYEYMYLAVESINGTRRIDDDVVDSSNNNSATNIMTSSFFFLHIKWHSTAAAQHLDSTHAIY